VVITMWDGGCTPPTATRHLKDEQGVNRLLANPMAGPGDQIH